MLFAYHYNHIIGLLFLKTSFDSTFNFNRRCIIIMILIVDDNNKYIERLISLLNEAGNESQVFVANDYNKGVEILANEKPDIVLLDVNLPGKSGIEILRHIREEAWKCKVIMATNHACKSYRNLCLEAGADRFLDKSKDFEKIPAVIAGLNKTEV